MDSITPELRAQGWSTTGLSRAIAALRNTAGDGAVQVVALDQDLNALALDEASSSEAVWCPLTTAIDLEALPLKWRSHPSLVMAARCGDIEAMQRHIAEAVACDIGPGTLWLPVVVTAKGPLYGEAILPPSDTDGPYQQPFHLSDRQRQVVYRLAHRILKGLDVPPAVYLLGLGLEQRGTDITKLWLDRVLPFPGEPAIASLGIQAPDLFECHWRCLTGQPLRDMIIAAS